MKNKNLRISPKNVVDGFSCILDFPKFSGGGPQTPLIEGIYQLSPQNLSATTIAAKYKKRGKPSPIKTIYKIFIFRLYRNQKLKKGGGNWGKIFFCVICN